MNPSEILSFISQRGIRLQAENGSLRYDAPKGALTPELHSLLKEHKDSLIEYLRGESAGTSETHPLSYSQQFLWFLYHLAPQSSAYNVAFVARVVSPIDFPRMDAAFQKLVDRHPMLRATYESSGGVPFMRIHSSLNLTCDRINASGWSEEALHREVHQRYREPFDLEKGPVLRVHFFTRAPEDHILLLTIHHIACDGWSIGILMQEFRDLYSIDKTINLPTGAAPYTDFTRDQSEMLKGHKGERLFSFWKQQLAGDLPDLNLPVDRQRPRRGIPIGGTHHFSITGESYRSIVSFARSSGVTLYTFLLASFQVLLMRYSSQDDILIGTPMASRPRKEDESTVGCYINPVVIRGAIPADSTFKELLGKTRRTFTDAFEHRHYPFPLLVEQLSPTRDPSRSPIFQVMFNFLNRQTLGEVANLLYRDKAGALAGESVDFGDLRMRPFHMDQEEGQFDLALEMIDDSHSLTGLLKYSTDLYEEATIARMAGHFETLLQGIVSDPNRHLSELPLLTSGERHHLLIEWNETATDYGEPVCLDTLFEKQVKKTPDAVAVVFEEASLTYLELDVRANRLAHCLRSLGVGPEVLVGVHLERSLDLVIALYAVLKAGGAYVPLDPDYPRERLDFMIKETGTPVILTQRRLKDKLPHSSAEILCLDAPESPWTGADGSVDVPPDTGIQPDNLAYVIYTSGSTGNPKGVMNTHRGICNRLLWMQETFQLAAEDVVLQKTPFSFDVSVWEFFWPLVSGAKLVVALPGGHRDSAYLARVIVERGVTTVHFVPSMLQIFLEDEKAASCKCLKRVICSGEALSHELQERFFILMDAELHNLYGPTEAAVDVTWWACRKGDERRTVPIGKPIANTQCYILDRHLQPVPIGVAGELYLGGVQIARGYLNRPELTAEKFIPDPFRRELGARLYKTGDLCRHLPDGNIEYLGRNDFQVKLRGMRIELGEIEAKMRQFPGVREAVVMAREDTPGDKRLVGYVVPASSSEINVDQFRSFLKTRLPDYMVPAFFLQLKAFPLTPSGKVDRRALPIPGGTRQTERVYVAPRGEAELRIVQIWQTLLHVEAVGLDDNFFDLGGHSLLLLRMAAKLQGAFHKDVSVVDLFQHPTVREQARLMEGEKSGDAALQEPQTRVMRKRSPLGHRAPSRRAEGGLRPSPPVVHEGIAVIGMACSFPGATNVDRFWKNLRQGVESIRHFRDEELAAMGVPPDVYNDPYYVKAASLLDDIDRFDAAFFGYAPKEAEIMDPQHRLFLECAWSALEHAGCDPGSYRGAIGVFGGAGSNYYGGRFPAASEDRNWMETYQRELGNEKDYLATRVAYKLNLKGPSLTIQTACSTSLVAVHVACQNLWTHQCDMALAGGVSINARMKGGYFYQEGTIMSPDGHCRAFDSRAQGTVAGQGVGIVVLKRLSDARADGDTIHAVIRGSAINNDGASRVGFTAPGVDGQSKAITAAQSAAGISPEDISYVEAHGTGTPLGDPIEIKALTNAFRLATDKLGFCAIGSLKTNVGHLDAAAGVAGLIKTVLMLEHREIPPSLHFKNPNPNLDLHSSPFFVNTQLREWKSNGTPRRAGVSAFGLGGTNAHVVVEETPLLEASGPSRERHVLLFSARTEGALDAATANMAAHLKRNPDLNLADIAFTLQVGRRAFEHRRTVVCNDLNDAIAALGSADPKRIRSAICDMRHRDIAFMFSGQGSQYVNMGLDLYKEEPVFREQIDLCSEILQQEMSVDLRKLLYPAQDRIDEADERLKQTSVSQPALFAVEFALAKLWMAWGICPQALVGHSIGEFTAACLAEVFSMEDALKLVAARGRLMQEMPPGRMLAVFMPEEQAASFINDDLCLAVVNGPSLCVVSGEDFGIAHLESLLAEKQVACRRLHTSHAFHSRMMDPVLAAFAERVKQVGPKPPMVPFLSNVTGTWITREEATDPDYWASHLRRTVRFSDCMQELFKEPNRVLLEVGPGRTLSVLASQHPAKKKSHVVLSSTRLPKEQQSDGAFILDTLCALWRAGVPVDWMGFHAGTKRRRVPLPSYPFERKRYWIDPEKKADATLHAGYREAAAWEEKKDRKEDATPSGATPSGSLSAVQQSLADIWRDLLGHQEIDLDDSFFELGGHSLIALRLLGRIERAYGKRFPLSTLIDAPTIRKLSNVVLERDFEPSWASLVTLRSDGRRPPFFCVHSEGGNVLEYVKLAAHMAPDQPFYALQARGLKGDSIVSYSVEEMAEHYILEMRKKQPKGPYHVGGYCLGGLIAYEMARQFEKSGESVAFLGLISSSTPEHLETESPNLTFLHRWWYGIMERVALEMSNLAVLDTQGKRSYMQEKIRRLGVVLRVKYEETSIFARSKLHLVASRHSRPYILEKVREAQNEAFYQFHPLPIKTKITLFRVSRQPRALSRDPALGWRGLSAGGVEEHEIKAFHKNILKDAQVISLAQQLQTCLGKAQSAPAWQEEK
jgi:amino acid adenylation domain-containing protein